MPESLEKRYSAPALEKGLDILEYLAGHTVPCSRAEIAEALNRTSNEIYRMLSVLKERGYVRKQEGTSAYRLTMKLFELGHLQSTTTALRRAARVPMEKLAEKIGQACHLSIQNGADLLVMLERMPARRICLAVGEGTNLPLTQTASGRVLLSQLDEKQARAFLKSDAHFRGLSSAAQRRYLDRVARVTGSGVEITRSELSPGVVDIALPVGIGGSELAGALAVSALENDPESSSVKRNLRAMRACVKEINRNLGI